MPSGWEYQSEGINFVGNGSCGWRSFASLRISAAGYARQHLNLQVR